MKIFYCNSKQNHTGQPSLILAFIGSVINSYENQSTLASFFSYLGTILLTCWFQSLFVFNTYRLHSIIYSFMLWFTLPFIPKLKPQVFFKTGAFQFYQEFHLSFLCKTFFPFYKTSAILRIYLLPFIVPWCNPLSPYTPPFL